jgi:transcriptional regulator with XRE-family HTH domain
MTKEVTIFVKRLKSQIKAGNIAKATLSKISGVERASIDNYLKGKYGPTLEDAARIANALGYTLSQFIEDKPSSVHTVHDCYEAIGKAIKK